MKLRLPSALCVALLSVMHASISLAANKETISSMEDFVDVCELYKGQTGMLELDPESKCGKWSLGWEYQVEVATKSIDQSGRISLRCNF